MAKITRSLRPKASSLFKRVFPHPALSLFMWGFWLLIVNDFSAGHIVLGAILAWFIPWLTYPFWPESTPIKHPLIALKFISFVLWDVVEANLHLMLRILGPTKNLQPSFVDYPLEIKNEFTITILASTISLAPGTFTANLSADKSKLLIHILNAADTDQIIKTIKVRYELPLKEIFEC